MCTQQFNYHLFFFSSSLLGFSSMLNEMNNFAVFLHYIQTSSMNWIHFFICLYISNIIVIGMLMLNIYYHHILHPSHTAHKWMCLFISPWTPLSEMPTDWNSQSDTHTRSFFSPVARCSRGLAAHLPVSPPSERAGAPCSRMWGAAGAYRGSDQSVGMVRYYLSITA